MYTILSSSTFAPFRAIINTVSYFTRSDFMNFQLVTSIEKLTNIALQGFEGQIRILHLLGPCNERPQHVENLKRMLDFLKQSIEADKEQLIENLEGVYSSIADELANQNQMISQAASVTNIDEIKRFSQKLAEVQPQIIKSLGAQETDVEKQILQRFKTLLENIQEIRARVEKIRV